MFENFNGISVFNAIGKASEWRLQSGFCVILSYSKQIFMQRLNCFMRRLPKGASAPLLYNFFNDMKWRNEEFRLMRQTQFQLMRQV